jgi:hypothetical protein
MKLTILFSSLLVTLTLATYALANDNATAPDGGFKGNGNRTAIAADSHDKGNGKEVSLSGEAKCAKCILHETDTCQTVIQTKDHGKVTTYYVTRNDVARGFRADVCTAAQMVNATGVVKDVGGKHQLTLAKISVKEK